MTQAEELALSRGGFVSTAPPLDEEDPVAIGERERRALCESSLDTAQAAKLLREKISQIRERLMAPQRTLYGIKTGGSWRIPEFQFTRSGLVPGIEIVIPRLAPSLHPVAVFRWFNTPNVDLELEDGRLVTPLDWLKTGRSASVVAALAEFL